LKKGSGKQYEKIFVSIPPTIRRWIALHKMQIPRLDKIGNTGCPMDK
jgi:hypothetical protein